MTEIPPADDIFFFLPERQSEGKVFLCQWFVAVKIKKKEYYI